MRKIKKRQKEFSLISSSLRSGAAFCSWCWLHPRSGGSLFFLIIFVVAWYASWPQKLQEFAGQKFDSATIKMGMEVKHIYLEGRRYAPAAMLQETFALEQGKPMLSISLPEIQSRAEALPWVQHAVVERLFPSTLSIHIIEREPVALWQYQGKIQALDAEGVAVTVDDLSPFASLLLLVGKDVPAHAPHLRSVLTAEPSLAPMVESAIRVGERRWNIRLHNGIEILLPEEDVERAWRFLATMHAESGILETKIKSIDLRLADKVYISK